VQSVDGLDMTLKGGVQAERMGCPIQDGARGGQRGGDTPRALGGIRARQVSLRGQTLRLSSNGEGWGHQIVHGVENEQQAHPGSGSKPVHMTNSAGSTWGDPNLLLSNGDRSVRQLVPLDVV
jgi:hypothetical protein